MNIKELAEQAGWDAHHVEFDTRIERFAELVVANIDPKSFMTWHEGFEAGVAKEREECAKVCEELLERPSGYQGRWEGYGKFKSQMTGQECAEAIRARSKL